MQEADKPAASFLINRAKEPTSWAGLVQLGVSAWLALESGDINGAVASGALVLTGLISIFRKERK